MMKNVMTGTFIKDNENVEFVFKTRLTTSEKAEFVSAITNVLVGDDYLSVLRDVFFNYYIVDMFTDVSIDIDDDGDSSDFINEIESFLEETNVANIVKANIDDELIDELNRAIDDNIEYRTGIHKNALNDALTSLINVIERKLNDIDMDNAMKMIESFNGIADDFTPESIVNAYVNTDFAKQNVNQVKNAKKTK